MTFASPVWLLLLLLAPAIVALHARRRRRLEVPSLLLWRRLPASAGASRRRNSPWTWPLALQLLVLLLVSLTLGEPRWTSAEAHSGGPWIVVLDRSSSMASSTPDGRLFDIARDHARRALEDALVSGRPVSLVFASEDLDVPVVGASDPDEVRAALERTTNPAGGEDWPATAAIVARIADEAPDARITLVTDRQGWTRLWRAVPAAFGEVDLEAIVLDGPRTNLAFHDAWLEPADDTAESWTIGGTVVFHGEAVRSTTVEVAVRPDGTESPLTVASVEVVADEGAYGRFRFETRIPAPADVELRLPGDDRSFDDEAYLRANAPARSVRVLHVGTADATLERAFLAVDRVAYYQAERLPQDADTYDIVILRGTDVDDPPATATVLWGSQHGSEDASSQATAPASTTHIGATHPLARGIDWGALEVGVDGAMVAGDDAVVLVEADDRPVVQVPRTASRRSVAVSIDLAQSDVAATAALPAFVANLVDWLAPASGRASLGSTCRVAEPCDVEAFPSSRPTALGEEEGRLGEQGREPDVASAAADRTVAGPFVPRAPGFFVVEGGHGRERLAVNAAPTLESKIAVDPVAPPVPSAPEGVPSPREALSAVRILLVLVLVAVVTEALVSGRYVERWLRATSLRARGPQGRRARTNAALVVGALACVLGAVVEMPLPRFDRGIAVVSVVAVGTETGSSDAASAAADLLTSGGTRLRHRGTIHVGEARSGHEEASAPLRLGDALEVARGMLAGDARSRILVVGRAPASQSSIARIAAGSAENGIPVDAAPLPYPSPDAWVGDVLVPERVDPRQRFDVEARLGSTESGRAQVRLLREGELLAERSVDLVAGSTDVKFAGLQEGEPGTVRFAIEVAAERDAVAGNDAAAVFLEVGEPRRVAVVVEDEAMATELVRSVRSGGAEVDVLAPSRAPVSLEGWLAYDAAILVDVPAVALHSRQQASLTSWVRETGGTLVLTGGEHAFGPGGYYQTRLERLSPLSSRIPREAERVAILFVLDRSGSMQQDVDDVTRIEIAKEAALSAIELLDDESLAGIVAFDSQATLLVPMRQRGRLDEFRDALSTVDAGGGTSLHPALVMAFEAVREVQASTRHIVVMSDGLSQPGDFDAIATAIAEEGITISAVAIGRGADGRILRFVASRGGGAFHETTDFQALPGILAQETMLLSSSPVADEPVAVAWADPASEFAGGMPRSLPPLGGFVETTPKPAADVVLETPEGEPLLAHWRFGTGRVVAFASHAAGPWARSWTRSEFYTAFWRRIVASRDLRTPRPGVTLRVVRDLDTSAVELVALGPNGEPASGMAFVGVAETPGGGERELLLVERGPGRYEADLATPRSGRYRLTVQELSGRFPESLDAGAQTSWIVPYPPLLDRTAPDASSTLARVSGGRVLLGDEDLASVERWGSWGLRRAWRSWLGVGAILFATSIVGRYAGWSLLERMIGRRPRPDRAGVGDASR